MLKPSVGVALEGLPYIITAAFVKLLFAILDCWFMTMVMLGLTLFIGHFFQNNLKIIHFGNADAQF